MLMGNWNEALKIAVIPVSIICGDSILAGLEHPVGTFQDLPSFFIIPSLTMFKPFNQNAVQVVIGIHGSFPILAS